MHPVETEPDNPFLPPRVRSDLVINDLASVGPRITIADILVCTLTLALALMVEYQRWGSFGSTRPAYVVSGLLAALSAGVLFTATRWRRQSDIPFSESLPGYNVALVTAGLLFTNVFQYLVSFLDIRHVGPPIHILALLSPMLYTIAACGIVFYKCKLATSWQAYFLVTAAYALLRLGGYACEEFANPAHLLDPYRVTAGYFFRFSAAAWSLSTIFLLYAYILDFFKREKRDWLHHAGAILGIAFTSALASEEPILTRIAWYAYNEILLRYF